LPTRAPASAIEEDLAMTLPDQWSLFEPLHERTIVTGGGSGIGRAVALALAEAGGTIYVMGRRAEKLAETAALNRGPGRIVPVPCDIREWDAVDRAFAMADAEGPVPALVHCASDVTHALAEQIDSAMFKGAVDTILNGTFHVLQRWGRPLREAGRPGVAIGFSSASCGRESPANICGSASKSGVEGLCRTMASEWGRFGLRINVVAPGLFPLGDTHHDDYWKNEGKRVFDHIPLGRPGALDEIVGPTLFMLSRAAGYMTGEILTVDGGYRLIQWPTARPEDFGVAR
jgi:NAD(P)-dependent dehydrogenase (short-subunit alcohol dehydrogenase family)